MCTHPATRVPPSSDGIALLRPIGMGLEPVDQWPTVAR